MRAATKLRHNAAVIANFTFYCYSDFQIDIAISKMTSKQQKQYH